MKPTWEKWSDIYEAQNADIYPERTCTYHGRWTEHDDTTWYSPAWPVQWDHCVVEDSEDYDLTTRMWLDSESVMLWNPTTDRPEEPYDTIWYPVEYAN